MLVICIKGNIVIAFIKVLNLAIYIQGGFNNLIKKSEQVA